MRHLLSVAVVIAAAGVALVIAGCGDDRSSPASRTTSTGGASDFTATLQAARGQTVRWWM